MIDIFSSLSKFTAHAIGWLHSCETDADGPLGPIYLVHSSLYFVFFVSFSGQFQSCCSHEHLLGTPHSDSETEY